MGKVHKSSKMLNDKNYMRKCMAMGLNKHIFKVKGYDKHKSIKNMRADAKKEIINFD